VSELDAAWKSFRKSKVHWPLGHKASHGRQARIGMLYQRGLLDTDRSVLSGSKCAPNDTVPCLGRCLQDLAVTVCPLCLQGGCLHRRLP
jgi:hypothetical protein